MKVSVKTKKLAYTLIIFLKRQCYDGVIADGGFISLGISELAIFFSFLNHSIERLNFLLRLSRFVRVTECIRLVQNGGSKMAEGLSSSFIC